MSAGRSFSVDSVRIDQGYSILQFKTGETSGFFVECNPFDSIKDLNLAIKAIGAHVTVAAPVAY